MSVLIALARSIARLDTTTTVRGAIAAAQSADVRLYRAIAGGYAELHAAAAVLGADPRDVLRDASVDAIRAAIACEDAEGPASHYR